MIAAGEPEGGMLASRSTLMKGPGMQDVVLEGTSSKKNINLVKKECS